MDQTTDGADDCNSRNNQGSWFTTTRWSLIINARAADPQLAAGALEQLCQIYRYPLYVYVRRRGLKPESAEDLIQGFFARFLARNDLAGVQSEKGRFRSFLLASLNHFLSDEWDRFRAQKRGGGEYHVSLDDSSSEDRYRQEPMDTTDPEKIFERRWALSLLEQARTRQAAEYSKVGKMLIYEFLWQCESRDANARTHAEIAVELKMTEAAVKAAAFRMRKRYQELVREEVAHTVATLAEVDEELRYLIAVTSK